MIELPDSLSQEAIADWVELTLSLYEEDVSRGHISKVIESSHGEEPPEYFLDGVWLDLKQRERAYNPKPFSVDDLNINYQPLEPLATAVHQACLILSLFGSHDTEIQNLFEQLSHAAVQCYVSGRSEIFAWRGGNIENRMRALAANLGETFVFAPPSTAKDAGVDVIAWKPFKDARSGQVVVLAQCASGRNWLKKFPVPLRNWNQYLRWAKDPIDAYTIPYFIPEGDWHANCRLYGIFFDRVRIVNLLAGLTKGVLRQDLQDWIDNWLDENEID